MNANLSRRRMMQALSVAAFNSTLLPAAAAPWPLPEGPGTPKICLELSAGRLSAGTPDEVGSCQRAAHGAGGRVHHRQRLPDGWGRDRRLLVRRRRRSARTAIGTGDRLQQPGRAERDAASSHARTPHLPYTTESPSTS